MNNMSTAKRTTSRTKSKSSVQTGIQPRLTSQFFAGRRKEFLRRMPANSVAIFVATPERTRSNDTEYAYRPSSDLLYLSNFPEPEAILMFVKGASGARGKSKFVMFVRPKDKMREIWTGVRAGVEGARERYGADEAYTEDQFEKVLRDVLDDAEQVLYRFDRNQHVDERFRKVWIGSANSQKTLGNPEEIVHEIRLFKTAEEIEIMRWAGAVSARAHMAAMQVTRPGMNEAQVQAVMEAIFRFNGASYPAYTSIVGGGDNATILHYIENEATLNSGDLLLIDAACEYQGYASDITRCFPVSGKFSPAQRALYEIVLEAEKAGIAMARPGVRLADIHETASNILRKGLVTLGLLPRTHLTAEGEKKALDAWKKAGSKGEQPLRLFDFYMHGTSHWIGLDVHDVGTYGTRSQTGKKRLLKPGMAFTIEPGLYVSQSETRVPAAYRGIGIRIEDDVVITADGAEVLTKDVVKEVADIERVMGSKQALAARSGIDELLLLR